MKKLPSGRKRRKRQKRKTSFLQISAPQSILLLFLSLFQPLSRTFLYVGSSCSLVLSCCDRLLLRLTAADLLVENPAADARENAKKQTTPLAPSPFLTPDSIIIPLVDSRKSTPLLAWCLKGIASTRLDSTRAEFAALCFFRLGAFGLLFPRNQPRENEALMRDRGNTATKVLTLIGRKRCGGNETLTLLTRQIGRLLPPCLFPPQTPLQIGPKNVPKKPVPPFGRDFPSRYLEAWRNLWFLLDSF